MISKLTILVALSLFLKICICEASLGNDSSSQIEQKSEGAPRNLADIKIEVDQKRKVKKVRRKSNRKLELKTGEKAIEEIEELINEFKLDSELDKKDTSRFFKKLENSIYRNMKKALYEQKSYVKNYSEVVEEYQRLAQEYETN